MPHAYFRFYADLNDFLPPRLQQRSFLYPVYDGTQSVKHLIESLGIPHTEVELILAGGQVIDFHYLVQAGDRITVYPPFATIDVSPAGRLRPALTPPHRFILDNHLGKLARYLRLLGLDTLYADNHVPDVELAHIAQDEQRILLSRDRGLLMRGNVTYGYCLRTKDSFQQLIAVLHRFQLLDEVAPWTRCLRCNGLLVPVDKETIRHRLEPKTKLYFEKFHMCRDCRQIYWQGSHYPRLQALIERALSTANE
jgi:uncharacterized protein with PIN domain